MVPEAELERTDEGLWPVSAGWFVVNARDLRWNRRPGRGHAANFTGLSEEEAETYFPLLGVNLIVIEPGEPNAMYHWETEQEGFLVLAGEALLIVEGQERTVRQWDYIHLPPQANHVLVGAGDGPCVVLAMGSRQFQAGGPWGAYTANETAVRHGAGVEEETQDARVAYARFPKSERVRYPDGLLP